MSIRTVQRWEAEFDLPVRRYGTGRNQVVHAFVDDIDRWLTSAGSLTAGRKDVDNPEADGGRALGTQKSGSSRRENVRGRRRSGRVFDQVLRALRVGARLAAAHGLVFLATHRR